MPSIILLGAGLAMALNAVTGVYAQSASASSSPSASVDNSGEYSITALPAVTTQPPCIFNCLIPIGLADPSGCDDVTNNCACLSAPPDALDVIKNCISTVCPSSKSAYASTAASLYTSYCVSMYGSASFASASTVASVSDALAAANATTSSTSMASADATATSSGMSMTTTAAAAPSAMTVPTSGAAAAAAGREIIASALTAAAALMVVAMTL